MTVAQNPDATTVSTHAGPALPAPAAKQAPDTGLLDTRAFIIVAFALMVGLLTGAGAGLAAAFAIEQAPAVAALVVGLSAGITATLATAATLNTLISRPAP